MAKPSWSVDDRDTCRWKMPNTADSRFCCKMATLALAMYACSSLDSDGTLPTASFVKLGCRKGTPA